MTLKYGAVFPQYEIGSDPIVIRDFIQAVEGMGYDFFLGYDHVLGANPEREGGWNGSYTYETQFHEVFTLYAYGAAITETLEFVTSILVLPQRQTALVAKQAAQIDVLSGGRFRMGVGVGWNKVEMEGLGEDFSNRGKRIEEQVEVLRLLWQNELVTYDGEYHKLDGVGINPLPVQRPIPIWFGGGADVVLKRMARIGDGWLPASMPIEHAKPAIEKLQGYLADNGRSFDDFGVGIRVSSGRQTPDEWMSYTDAWRDWGLTHVEMVTMGDDKINSVDDHLKALQQYIDMVK